MNYTVEDSSVIAPCFGRFLTHVVFKSSNIQRQSKLMLQELNFFHVYLDYIPILGYLTIRFKNLIVLQCCNLKTFMVSKCRNMVMMT
jgi:hypothetical protein